MVQSDAGGGQSRKTRDGPGEHIMLRGRYGVGWMILGWAVIVVLIGAGIYVVGNANHLFSS